MITVSLSSLYYFNPQTRFLLWGELDSEVSHCILFLKHSDLTLWIEKEFWHGIDILLGQSSDTKNKTDKFNLGFMQTMGQSTDQYVTILNVTRKPLVWIPKYQTAIKFVRHKICRWPDKSLPLCINFRHFMWRTYPGYQYWENWYGLRNNFLQC